MSVFLLEIIIWVPFYARKLKFGMLLTQTYSMTVSGKQVLCLHCPNISEDIMRHLVEMSKDEYDRIPQHMAYSLDKKYIQINIYHSFCIKTCFDVAALYKKAQNSPSYRGLSARLA